MTIYERVRNALPSGARTRLRAAVEYAFDVGARRFYSQFGEDAVLQAYFEEKAWSKDRNASAGLRSIRIEQGFYVDVGAFSPKQHSTTYHFYRQGWRGINIDATPDSMRAFDLIRPRDTNIEIAVSDQEQDLIFYSWGTPSVLNTVSADVAREWERETGRTPRELTVRSMRMETILNRYLPEGQDISFVTIDAEGHDLAVLRSNDWNRYRPELVLTECHGRDIRRILESETVAFMENVGYAVYSWVPPTIIFKRSSRAGDLDAGRDGNE